MPEPTNPFEDAEFVQELRRAGIEYVPGSGAEFFESIAPLLAAEGIDLDNPSPDLDLDKLNDVLAQAAERHNLENFTPLGVQREQAIDSLRRFAVAICDGDAAGAAAVLDELERDATQSTPAISHVIGVSLGLLDDWFTDSALTDALFAARVPQWSGPPDSRAAARRALLVARSGSLFDHAGQLIMAYGGLAVLHGVALAVAGALISAAEFAGTSVNDQAVRLVGERGPVARVTAQDAEELAALAADSRDLVARFETWLHQVGVMSAESIDSGCQALAQVFTLAQGVGLRPDDPQDIEDTVDLILEVADMDVPEAVDAVLRVLNEYIHFQLATADLADEWDEAHALVEGMLDDGPDDAMMILADVIDDAAKVNPRERRAAAAKVAVVAQVKALLELIGKSRPITGSGGLRRADIGPVAAMLGISAVGVNKMDFSSEGRWQQQMKLNEPLPVPSPIQAMSMGDVPVLAAWWRALVAVEVLELTASRVRWGRNAALWLAEKRPPLELAESVIAIFIAELLTCDLDTPTYYMEPEVVTITVALLIDAMQSRTDNDDRGELPGHLLMPRGLRNLEYLRTVGLVRRSRGNYVVPPLLRGPVGRGVLITIAMTNDHLDEDDFGQASE